jgi:hypothetical protein
MIGKVRVLLHESPHFQRPHSHMPEQYHGEALVDYYGITFLPSGHILF